MVYGGTIVGYSGVLAYQRDPVLGSVNWFAGASPPPYPPPPPTYTPRCKRSAKPLNLRVTQGLQISLLQGYEGSEVR
jgi:hypothetical protein